MLSDRNWNRYKLWQVHNTDDVDKNNFKNKESRQTLFRKQRMHGPMGGGGGEGQRRKRARKKKEEHTVH
jgi:hypothetical protein